MEQLHYGTFNQCIQHWLKIFKELLNFVTLILPLFKEAYMVTQVNLWLIFILLAAFSFNQSHTNRICFHEGSHVQILLPSLTVQCHQVFWKQSQPYDVFHHNIWLSLIECLLLHSVLTLLGIFHSSLPSGEPCQFLGGSGLGTRLLQPIYICFSICNFGLQQMSGVISEISMCHL